MNFSLKPLCLATLGLAVLFAGCASKPRPDPTGTITPLPDSTTTTAIAPPNPNPVFTNNQVPPPAMGNNVPGLENRGDFSSLDGKRGVLVSVFFDLDKSTIKSSEFPKLQAAMKYLADNPDLRLTLEGHCDWRGTAEYNLGLGDRRAAAVKKYLENLKVSPDKLDVLSKGSIGAAEKGTESQMSNDRRVEFVLFKAGAAPAPSGTTPVPLR